MAIWKKIYLHLLVTVYALYCYFNKGIAYTYLTEGTLVIGILLMLKHIKQYVFIWRKETAFIVFF